MSNKPLSEVTLVINETQNDAATPVFHQVDGMLRVKKSVTHPGNIGFYVRKKQVYVLTYLQQFWCLMKYLKAAEKTIKHGKKGFVLTSETISGNSPF